MMNEIRIDEKKLVEVLSGRLRAVKEKLGLSRDVMAQELRLDPSTVSRYIHGTMAPSLAGLIRIHRVLGVSLDWLLLGVEPMMLEDRLKRERETGDVVDALTEDSDLLKFFETLMADRGLRYQTLGRFFDERKS
jgi:transcriptional regulator with XRE-family HTH domain